MLVNLIDGRLSGLSFFLVLNSGSFMSVRCTVSDILNVPDVVIVNWILVSLGVAPTGIFLILSRLQLLPLSNKHTNDFTK